MKYARRWRAALFLGALLGPALLSGCGGGGGEGPAAGTNFAGDYRSDVSAGTGRMFLFTLRVRDSGAASGAVSFFDETAAARTQTRHAGHAVLAAGPVTGAADRATRQFSAAGTLTYAGGATTPITVRGTLRRVGVDRGSVTVEMDNQTYTGVFDE